MNVVNRFSLNRLLLLILQLVLVAQAISPQDTIYDYNNRTVYIHLNGKSNSTTENMNQLFKIPFNTKFASGDSISNYTITPPPVNDCSIVVTSLNLLSFCPNGTDLLEILRYDNGNWKSIPTDSDITFYNDSAYIHTQSDETGVYIFSGFSEYMGIQVITDQMLRLDTETWEVSDATSRIQPLPFYKSTNVKINSNTEAFFGGISTGNTLVPMMEIPLWQYNSWTERPCDTSTATNITSRIDPLILPVFYNTNKYLLNETLTTFEVSSILMLGGTDLKGTAVKPSGASLDISTYKWQWTDLTNVTSIQNEEISEYDTQLSVGDTVAAATIYDSLLMIEVEQTKNSKRHLISEEYIITLYNATTFEYLETVDYSYLTSMSSNQSQNYHFNKNLTIALSVVIPILAIILLTVLLVYLYQRYKTKKEEERYGREVREIVDFYENQHKRNSAHTFSSYDSDYKSSNYTDDFYSDDVKINDYEDGDNLSLKSWKRKKREFEYHTSIFEKVKPSFSKKRSSNSLKRTFSTASNIIQQSLLRKPSTQFSIDTFSNKDLMKKMSQGIGLEKTSVNENPFHSADLYTIRSDVSSMVSPLPTPPPPAVPKHTAMFTLPDRTESLLYHIPENTSVSTFHSQNLGYLPLKLSTVKSSPQQSYMKQVRKHERVLSGDLSFDSSIYSATTNYYNSSPSRSPSRSPRRPLSIMSASSVYSNNDKIVSTLPPLGFSNIEEVNEDESSTHEVGSIKDEELSNMEVQVLVGSKRRSKLRVVNPDSNTELACLKEEAEESINVKERCASSSSEKSHDNAVRKRHVSDNYNDDSFVN